MSTFPIPMFFILSPKRLGRYLVTLLSERPTVNSPSVIPLLTIYILHRFWLFFTSDLVHTLSLWISRFLLMFVVKDQGQSETCNLVDIIEIKQKIWSIRLLHKITLCTTKKKYTHKTNSAFIAVDILVNTLDSILT